MLESEISINDTAGKLVYSSYFKTSEITVDLARFNSGVYFVKIKTDKEIYSGKIIVR